jgi:hypothetical protein
MDLDELLSVDPNTLPYRLVRVGTGEVVEARFEATGLQDAEHLARSKWAEATFAAIWPDAARRGEALKLVRSHGEDRRIQGILIPGRVHYRGCGLWGSLVESAPWNQWDAPHREYASVGHQLVLRLICEALHQDGEGSIYIHPAPKSASFYANLGFVEVTRGAGHEMVLKPVAAFALLRAAWGDI